MSVPPSSPTISVALVGNPNTGKSTLFNALSGARQRTGNYPGVTVEKKMGRAEIDGQPFLIVDLPGTYSLAPRSPDEMVTVDVLLGRQAGVDQPDIVLCIIDASNLERNFYLLSQVLELGLPTVVALNMVDIARDKGQVLNLAKLRERLNIPWIEVQANKGLGIEDIRRALALASSAPRTDLPSPFPPPFQQEVQRLVTLSQQTSPAPLPRYLLERLLLDTSDYLATSGLAGVTAPLVEAVKSARQRLADAGLPVPGVEAMSRYQWAGEILAGVVSRPAGRKTTLSDRLDRLLTHRVGGLLVFVILMLLMFQAVFYVASPAKLVIEGLTNLLSQGVNSVLDEGPLQSLLNDGVIAGVGGVLVFLPQICTLFFFIAVLEDCGYMARAAYLMDRLMSQIGLSGKSFIPLLSSFACAVPGIMAARVIENRRDRLITILIAPLMSCSARLPVYILLTMAFVPEVNYLGGWLSLRTLVMFSMYLLGMVTGVLVALILKFTLLRGKTPPFVMELPSYKMPGIGIVLSRMFEQGWSFAQRAGTLILAISVVVWALAYYPHNAARLPSDVVGRNDPNEIAGAYLSDSFLGRLGHAIEPAVRPLGWDWKIGCAAIASFPAREVVVATLGVIYNLGEGQTEESATLQESLRDARWEGTDRRVFNLPVALSLMVFFALCAQCVSTLVVMYQETGSVRWPLFTFVYMTTLAYLGALVTYQTGIWLIGPGGGG